MTTLATDAGPTDIPLLDETIGANLARTVAAHGDVEALVARHQGVRWTYDELAERVARCAKGLLAPRARAGDRVGLWSPNYAEWTLLQYATAEIGVILVNINPAYRTHELPYALAPVGLPDAVRRAVVQDVRLRRHGRAGRARTLPGLERAVFFWDDDWDELVAGAGHVTDDELGARGGRRCGPTTRSTSSTRRARPGSRRAPRSPTATSSTTATSWPGCRASSPATGCASPCPSTTASAW